MHSLSTPSLGIDLGTTFSCAYVYMDNHTRLINDKSTASPVIPSIFCCLDEGEGLHFLVGKSAQYKIAKHAKSVVYDLKRLIGKDFDDANVQTLLENLPYDVVKDSRNRCKVRLHGQEFFPEAISAKILERFKKLAEEQTKAGPIKNVVISIPAYFGDLQRKSTIEAGRLAGFEVVNIINEPTAAAIAYGYQHPSDDEQKVVVYDMGGGTFDVSVLVIEDHFFDVQCTGGDNYLGGNDFDNLLVQECVREIGELHGKDISHDEESKLILKFECEQAKKALSGEDTEFAMVRSSKLDKRLGAKYKGKFTQSQFESLVEGKIDKSIEIVIDTLNRAKLEAYQIDKVLLVGGSTYIPMIRRKLGELFGNWKIQSDLNPDLCVAMGASIFCADKNGFEIKKLPDFGITETVPISIGVGLVNDKFGKVIKRGFNIPCRQRYRIITIKDNQTVVKIEVLEGERSIASKNEYLGECSLSGIPPLPKGQAEVDIIIEIDENSTMKVTSESVQNGVRRQNHISYNSKRLSKEEVQKILDDKEANKEADQQFLEKVQSKYDFKCLLNTIKSNAQDPRNDKYMSSTDKQKLLSVVAEHDSWFCENSDFSTSSVKKATEKVRLVWEPIFSKIRREFRKDKGHDKPINMDSFDDIE